MTGMEEFVIGAYKNKNSGDLAIFPWIRNKIGAWTSVNKPITIESPYTAEVVGGVLLKCMETVINNDFAATDIGQPIIKTKRNKDMTKLYFYQSVRSSKNEGCTFYPTIGEYDGSFSFMGKDNNIRLNNAATKYELGETLLKIFDLCR